MSSSHTNAYTNAFFLSQPTVVDLGGIRSSDLSSELTDGKPNNSAILKLFKYETNLLTNSNTVFNNIFNAVSFIGSYFILTSTRKECLTDNYYYYYMVFSSKNQYTEWKAEYETYLRQKKSKAEINKRDFHKKVTFIEFIGKVNQPPEIKIMVGVPYDHFCIGNKKIYINLKTRELLDKPYIAKDFVTMDWFKIHSPNRVFTSENIIIGGVKYNKIIFKVHICPGDEPNANDDIKYIR